MSRRTKWVLGIVAVLVLVFGAISIAAQIYLAPFVKQQIERKGSEALGAPLTVGSLSIGIFPPLTANASDVTFSAPEYNATGTIKRLSLRARLGLSFDIKRAISDLKIQIVEPQIVYTLTSAKTPESPANPTPTPAPADASEASSTESSITDLKADIEIENGRVEVIEAGKVKYLIEDLALDTRFTGLGSPAKLNTQLKVSAPELLANTQIPITLASEFMFDGINFSTQATNISIAQLKATLSGKQNIKIGDGEWKLKAEARDFGASGKFADMTIKGAVTGDLDTTVVLSKNSLSLRSLILAADLSRADLNYKDLFLKPAGTPLIVDARGSTEADLFTLDNAKVIFDKLEASLSASIPLPTAKSKTSNLKFTFSRTSLTGWEKFFPLLGKAPVTGFLEGAGSFEGDLQNSKSYRVTIKPLKLEQINALVDWQSEDKTKVLRGPVLVNGSVDLIASGTDIQSAQADLVADLTKMSIEIKDAFSKPSNSALRAQLHATQRNMREIELTKTLVQLGTNQLIFSGTIQEPQKPKLNLTISAPKVSITELSSMLLAMKKYNLTGQGRGEFKLTGTYDFAKGIEKSLLSVSGSLNAEIPSLKCPETQAISSATPAPSEPPQPKTPGAQPSQAKPEPMLPPWPIARTAVVNTKVSIKQLTCKGVQASGVNLTGLLSKGLLTGALSIQKVFDGKVDVKPFKTNLSVALPDTEATVKTEAIDVNQAVTWFSPKWKDMIKGRLYGTNQFFAPDSSRPDFLAKTRAQGAVQIKNAFVSTLQIDQIINKALAKIPGLGGKETVNSKGVAATINADYTFADAVMNLKKFNFLSPEKNEIIATGTIDINQNAKISGTAYLATAPVGGSVKAANSDPQGRLVLPFELNGNLMNPSVSFAEKTIQKLAENTAKKELDNLKGRAQEQGKKELEKKLEELKKKGLKGLFGK